MSHFDDLLSHRHFGLRTLGRHTSLSHYRRLYG